MPTGSVRLYVDGKYITQRYYNGVKNRRYIISQWRIRFGNISCVIRPDEMPINEREQ